MYISYLYIVNIYLFIYLKLSLRLEPTEIYCTFWFLKLLINLFLENSMLQLKLCRLVRYSTHQNIRFHVRQKPKTERNKILDGMTRLLCKS